MTPPRLLAPSLCCLLIPAVASAHVGAGATHGLAAGLAHPFLGLDHVAAMAATGLWASMLGGRAGAAAAAGFLSLMAGGAAWGMAGGALPAVETGIALSALALGLCVALRWKASAMAAAGVAALFALFHGYAHGAEAPLAAGAGGYAVGFLIAAAALIGLGAAAGRALREGAALRAAGGAIAMLGGVLAAGTLGIV
jgi:urease accessory protein